MNIQKTIARLKSLKEYCEEQAGYEKATWKTDDSIWDEDIQALEVAIEIAEKEIPEKPIFKTDYDVSANYYVCPVCGDMVTDKKDEPDYHCSGCGQKLDWKEEE